MLFSMLLVKQSKKYPVRENSREQQLLQAARDGEWGVVEQIAQRYGRAFDAALVAAECGHLDLVGSAVFAHSELMELMGAACRGGQLEVARLLLDRGGVGVNDKLANGSTMLMRCGACLWASERREDQGREGEGRRKKEEEG